MTAVENLFAQESDLFLDGLSTWLAVEHNSNITPSSLSRNFKEVGLSRKIVQIIVAEVQIVFGMTSLAMAQSLSSSTKLARTNVLMHAIMDDRTMDNVYSFMTFCSMRALLAMRLYDHRWLQLINFYLVVFFYWIFGRLVSLGEVSYPLIIIEIRRR
ncbi:hypothetical protein BDR07DRAFT_1423763 [Suillus spraguei]|nr:hypothetical protein BDR07DRAFT_1423763 [Suillus spraguei]